MDPKLEEALIRDFPTLFADLHAKPPRAPISYGVGVENGWEPTIRRLSEKLEPLVRGTGTHFFQLKEKVGVLRIYVNVLDVDPEIRRAISEAERESAVTCELCGAPGRLRNSRRWIRVLCDACEERQPSDPF
jgi:hypothetical protein